MFSSENPLRTGANQNLVAERGVVAFARQYIVSTRDRTGNRTVTQMRHPLLVEGRPNSTRQSLASTLLALAVAATSYCHLRSPRECRYPLFAYPLLNLPLHHFLYSCSEKIWQKNILWKRRPQLVSLKKIFGNELCNPTGLYGTLMILRSEIGANKLDRTSKTWVMKEMLQALRMPSAQEEEMHRRSKVPWCICRHTLGCTPRGSCQRTMILRRGHRRQWISSQILPPDSFTSRLFGSEKHKEKHVNKCFTGLSRDFGCSLKLLLKNLACSLKLLLKNLACSLKLLLKNLACSLKLLLKNLACSLKLLLKNLACSLKLLLKNLACSLKLLLKNLACSLKLLLKNLACSYCFLKTWPVL